MDAQSLESIVKRVEDDPQFAKDLQAKAQAAAPTPPGGPEWVALLNAISDSPEEREKMAAALMKQKAASPQDLSRMMAKLQKVEGAPTTTTTTTTVTGTSMTTLATTMDCWHVVSTVLV
jgi:hypothetical protein